MDTLNLVTVLGYAAPAAPPRITLLTRRDLAVTHANKLHVSGRNRYVKLRDISIISSVVW